MNSNKFIDSIYLSDLTSHHLDSVHDFEHELCSSFDNL